MANKKKETNDVVIDVVDNGFLAKIGKRQFVFSDLDALDGWIKDNFKKPKDAKKIVSKQHDTTKAQRDLIDAFGEININPQPIHRQPPFNNPLPHTYIAGPDISSGTASGGYTPTTGSTSSETHEQLLEKIFNTRGTFDGGL